MQSNEWQPVFEYLKHEAGFQAAAAAATGAAAAWLLKAILAPPRDAPALKHPVAARVAGGFLAMASFLFLVEQGRLAKVYGELALHVNAGTQPDAVWREHLVREFWDLSTLWAWSPYYGARGLLLVVLVAVGWMLFAELRSNGVA